MVRSVIFRRTITLSRRCRALSAVAMASSRGLSFRYRYGPVAQLQGIYRTKFVDDRSIPADCYGYVALAQGLGMVSGNSSNRFLPNSNATRAQAAVMLYNLMDR